MRAIPYIQPDAQGWLAKFHFSIPIKVRYCETDMAGHLNNVSYFIYYEQGRVDYLEQLGLSDVLFNARTVSVTADLECQFLAQVLKKEPLMLYVRVAKLGRSSFDLEYALTESSTGQLKAVGRGAMVYIDKASEKSIPLPDVVREAIAKYEGASLGG
ncbi:acyl-CoA thioesterase [Paenibacillus cremeus]|uniref:Acyl-CoA thioesterase n=1 Tax=Paenibacillus cremeus TaxID=2163881 RepID=A0A559K912_9BACL|nr:thioesterase family protein [Paenibacillus cremeus]TVY08607.1 acyl-CoA thioesterase [Paenibacillus cremeus]